MINLRMKADGAERAATSSAVQGIQVAVNGRLTKLIEVLEAKALLESQNAELKGHARGMAEVLARTQSPPGSY